jgi:hypothetical protein
MKALIWRPICRDAGVERAFDQIRSYLAVNPGTVLGDLPAYMHVRAAGLDVSRNVQADRGDLEVGGHVVRIPLGWSDARRPELFPVVEATLEVTPESHDGRSTTRLQLAGRYRAPFGRPGAVVNALVGQRLLLQSVDRFLAGLAERLELELPPDAVMRAVDVARHSATRSDP